MFNNLLLSRNNGDQKANCSKIKTVNQESCIQQSYLSKIKVRLSQIYKTKRIFCWQKCLTRYTKGSNLSGEKRILNNTKTQKRWMLAESMW